MSEEFIPVFDNYLGSSSFCTLNYHHQVPLRFNYRYSLSMFLEVLHWYFKEQLEELSTIIAGDSENDDNGSEDKDDMDLDGKNTCHSRTGFIDIDECSEQRSCLENKLVKNIGIVVHDLRNLGFTSMTEDAYASAIFLLLKVNMCYVMVLMFSTSHFSSYWSLASTFVKTVHIPKKIIFYKFKSQSFT